MPRSLVPPEFLVHRDEGRCTKCKACIRQCGFGVHAEGPDDRISANDQRCVNCQRCVVMCPTGALKITANKEIGRENAYWSAERLREIWRQAESGGAILTSMGCDRNYPVYFDHLLLNASQVTNPSIDPLREPMEIRTFLGRKPEKLSIAGPPGEERLAGPLPPEVRLEMPVMFAAMSFGSISKNTVLALAKAAKRMGIMFNTGEGGMNPALGPFRDHMIVQVASGRFGVDSAYLEAGRIIEIKIGQGAKPGIGGHLPGEKVNAEIARTRGIPTGADAISPAPHHDIYSIEDLRQLIYTLKEATDYQKPVAVKIAAVHNVAAIASGIVRAGADIVVLDGLRGGTGAAPKMIRDHIGLPVELAIAVVDRRLREEGLREQVSLVAGGGIRSSADLLKVICLGADAAYLGTAALLALGCHLCQRCYTGKCSWGIATQDPSLTKRVDPEAGADRLVNLLTAWQHELKEFMGAMGINALESMRGNRLQLRGVGLPQNELDQLGVKQAGEAM
ncbi:MAG: 4Fe-4S binding protein [Firmicutes bacterium]|nr:4Fe-4S binding protein [Bacillota bacterium]